jgi:hypothetical protein
VVHNAMSSRDDLFTAYNNVHPLKGALVAGYRGLMLDSCVCNGSIGENVANAIKGDRDKVREGRGGDDSRSNRSDRCPAGVGGGGVRGDAFSRDNNAWKSPPSEQGFDACFIGVCPIFFIACFPSPTRLPALSRSGQELSQILPRLLRCGG